MSTSWLGFVSDCFLLILQFLQWQVTNGDLEQAATLYLESGGEDISTSQQSTNQTNNDTTFASDAVSNQSHDGYREPIAPRRDVLMEASTSDMFAEFTATSTYVW
jgi:hypothetical protein